MFLIVHLKIVMYKEWLKQQCFGGELVMKHVHIIEMSGTISAQGIDRLDLKDYTSGIFHRDDYLEQIPELTSIANLSFTTFSKISSTKITTKHWIQLRQIIIDKL